MPPKVDAVWVGCAAGGARTESAEAAVRGLSAMSGPGTTPVLGRAERLQPADAALASCLASAADTGDRETLARLIGEVGLDVPSIIRHADDERWAALRLSETGIV